MIRLFFALGLLVSLTDTSVAASDGPFVVRGATVACPPPGLTQYLGQEPDLKVIPPGCSILPPSKREFRLHNGPIPSGWCLIAPSGVVAPWTDGASGHNIQDRFNKWFRSALWVDCEALKSPTPESSPKPATRKACEQRYAPGCPGYTLPQLPLPPKASERRT